MSLLLSACGERSAAPSLFPGGSPPASSNAAPNATRLEDLSLEQAVSLVRTRVPEIEPLLVPTWAPTAMRASAYAYTGAYGIFFEDGTGRRIGIAVVVGGLAPPGAYGLQAPRAFRGDPDALYQIFDTRDPFTDRALLWNEPTSRPDPHWPRVCSCIPYTLISRGISEAEFWRFANELR